LRGAILPDGEEAHDTGTKSSRSWRLFLLWEAERIGIKRFQANNIGKDLVVLLDGPDELVERFVKYAREKRPEGAEVEEIIEEDFEDSVMSIEAYHRLLMTEQLFKIVNVGRELIGGQDKLVKGQKVLIRGQEKLISGQERLLKEQEEIRRVKGGHQGFNRREALEDGGRHRKDKG